VKGWKAVTGLFLATTILESVAMGHLNAYTPLYLGEMGLAPEEVSRWTGLLYGAMMATAFPLAPFWGALAERYSRRLIIVRSQYFEAVAYLIMALAPGIWWVVVARLLLGLTFGNIAVVIATQTMLTPRRHMGTAIAIIQVAAPIAASLGPPLGAGLIGMIGVRGLLVLDAIMALTAALLITFLMPEPAEARRKTSVLARTRESMVSVWNRPSVRWNFLCWYLSVGARAVVDVYLPVRIAEVTDDPAPAIGLILGVSGIMTALGTWVAARLVDDAGGIRWFYPAMVAAALTTAGVAFVPGLWPIAILTWIRALPFSLSNTILYAHLTRILSPADRTAILSLTPTPRNLASFMFPMVAALVAPLGVGVALMVGALSYGGAAITGLLATRTTPIELRRLADERASAVGDV
jgi:DHA1 family multidrug resistance protein-like MFS transporter